MHSLKLPLNTPFSQRVGKNTTSHSNPQNHEHQNILQNCSLCSVADQSPKYYKYLCLHQRLTGYSTINIPKTKLIYDPQTVHLECLEAQTQLIKITNGRICPGRGFQNRVNKIRSVTSDKLVSCNFKAKQNHYVLTTSSDISMNSYRNVACKVCGNE